MCSFCAIYKEEKTYTISFMTAPMRERFGTGFAIVDLIFGVKIWTYSLKQVVIGFLNRNDLLNYFIMLGKLCIRECRRKKSIPKFNLFLRKVEANKKESEKLIALKNKKLQDFGRRWEPLLCENFCCDTVRQEEIYGWLTENLHCLFSLSTKNLIEVFAPSLWCIVLSTSLEYILWVKY